MKKLVARPREEIMEVLKQIFGDKSLTYEELDKALGEKGIKLGDLASGKYVDKKKYEDLEADYKKKLEETQTKLTAIEAKEDSEEAKKQIASLKKEKAELETKQAETALELDRLTKRDLAISKTGITDPDFLELVQARYGSQDISEFEKQVVAYAKASKSKWDNASPSPDLNGEPNVNSQAAFEQKFMQAAGAVYDEKGK